MYTVNLDTLTVCRKFSAEMMKTEGAKVFLWFQSRNHNVLLYSFGGKISNDCIP